MIQKITIQSISINYFLLVGVFFVFIRGNTQNPTLLLPNAQILSRSFETSHQNKKLNDSISNVKIPKLTHKEHTEKLEEKWLQLLFTHHFDTEKQTEFVNENLEVDLDVDLLKERLIALDNKTPISIIYSPLLESEIRKLLKTHRPSLEALMALSSYYFPLFEKELADHNLPLGLKYLPIVESGLDALAKSRVGATGLWQFMYDTAKMMKMDINSYIDERLSPEVSTKSAALYLKYLYDVFEKWDLALAAYNSGPGNVMKAIRRSGGEPDYWNIRNFLPRETANYVPTYLATMYLYEYASEHGFSLKEPPFHLYKTDTLIPKKFVALDEVSKRIDVTKEELQFLNPQYKLGVIPKIEKREDALRLPIDKIAHFLTKEEEIYVASQEKIKPSKAVLEALSKINNEISYRVKEGDFLGKIAEKFGVRVSQLKRWNRLKSNRLKIGQRLLVYPRKPTKTKEKFKRNYEGKQTYTVQDGDSLWTIAQKFSGISVQNIKKWNGISGSKLKIGEKLIVSH